MLMPVPPITKHGIENTYSLYEFLAILVSWLDPVGLSVGAFQAASPLATRVNRQCTRTIEADILHTLILGQLITKILIGAIILQIEVLAAMLSGLACLVLQAAAVHDEASNTPEDDEQTMRYSVS